mmetsp:Transcript_19958/g.61965  ORF Transcript_19958/g.61965 Transcript_19958/m.61965 type:complete len:250 (-) Transcript_19958:3497-4246(-)
MINRGRVTPGDSSPSLASATARRMMPSSASLPRSMRTVTFWPKPMPRIRTAACSSASLHVDGPSVITACASGRSRWSAPRVCAWSKTTNVSRTSTRAAVLCSAATCPGAPLATIHVPMRSSKYVMPRNGEAAPACSSSRRRSASSHRVHARSGRSTPTRWPPRSISALKPRSIAHNTGSATGSCSSTEASFSRLRSVTASVARSAFGGSASGDTPRGQVEALSIVPLKPHAPGRAARSAAVAASDSGKT